MELSLANLFLVLTAALAGGSIASRFGYPSILGELLAGIVFGPALVGVLSADESLAVLGEVGVLLMMLYIGLHLDLGDLRRASWPGFLAAIGGFIVPAGFGYMVALAFGATGHAALFIGLAMGVTSLATKSRILVDLGILDTRIAHVLIAGALLSDMAVLVVFAAVVGVVGGTSGSGELAVAGDVLLVLGKVAFFIVVAYVAGSRLLPLIGRAIRRWGAADRSLLFLALVLVGLAFAELAEFAGLHAILGAFVAGLFVDERVLDRRAARDVQQLLRAASVGLLAPIFFVTAGFHVTLDVFRTDLGLLVMVVAVATVGKIIGTALFYLPSGHGWREGITVGTGMNGRGAIEIIVAEIALELGLIDGDVFSILVVMAIATTATVPVLLTMSVKWLRRRGELVRSGTRRGVVLIGAGPVACRLAAALQPAEVRLVDTNPDHTAAARDLGLEAVVGNALDEDVLARVGADQAASLIAMTPNSNVNVLVAQLGAGSFAVPDVHVALGARVSAGLHDLLVETGACRLFDRPVDLAEWDIALMQGRAREGVIDVDRPPENVEALQELPSADHTAAGVLPLVVIRGSERLLFSRAGDLEIGDRVVVLVRATSPFGVGAESAPTAVVGDIGP